MSERPPIGAPDRASGRPVAERTPAAAWLMLGVLFILYFMSFLDRAALSILVEPVKADLGATDTQMSLALGPAFTLMYAIFGLPLGWAADRLPRRWVIYLGTTLWSLASAASGLARSFTALLCARAGIGIGEAALSPAAFSMMADRFPRHRLALAMAVYQSAPWLGGAAAFLITPFLLRNSAVAQRLFPVLSGLHPWQVALVLMGASGIGLALLIFTSGEPKRRKTTIAGTVTRGEFLRFLGEWKRIIVPLMIAFGLISMLAYAVQAWTPAYLERSFGLRPAQFGPVLGIAGLLTGLSLFVKGAVMDWMFSRGVSDAYIRIYIALLFISVPASALLFFVHSVTVFAICYVTVQVITFAFMGFLAPTIQVITPPALRGRTVGLFLLVFSGCGAAGPVIVAMATDRLFGDPRQIGLALGAMSVCAVPAALLLLCFTLAPLRAAVAANAGPVALPDGAAI